MLTLTSVTRRDILLLLIIVAIAAFLRLGEPGIIEFQHDEGMLSIMAQDMAYDGVIPLTGIPSSVGVPNPPISVYIMALPYALSDSPQFATLFIAALNVIGVGLLWLIAHRYLGRVVAFVAGLAYALNPWAILYSRKIWAQDYHTPLVLLGLLVGLYGFLEGKRWAQITCLPILIIAFQIHFAAWALLPLFIVLLWMGRKHVFWRGIFFSVILAFLMLLPFLMGLSQTLEQDPQRLSNALTRQSQRSGLTFSSNAGLYTAYLATGLGLETWVAPEQPIDLLTKVPPPSVLWLIIGTVELVGLAALIWMKDQHYFAPLLIAWVGLPLVIFTPTWTLAYPHYFIASIPALCLLAGLGVAFITEKLPRKAITQPALVAAFSLILLTQGSWWRSLLGYLDRNYTPSGFGTPMHYLTTVRDSLAKYDDVLIVSDGFWTLYDQEPAIWSALLRRTATCVRAVAGNGVAVFPNHPFAVATAPNAPEYALNHLYHTPDEMTFKLRRKDGVYTVNTFTAAPVWNGTPLTPIPLVKFSGGLQLTGYHLDQKTLYLEWLLPGRVSEDYHYFGHFLDAKGEKLGQRDNILWPGQYWCAGDRLITWVDVELPPQTTTLRIGTYTLDRNQFVNVPVLNSTGNSVSTWVDIPLTAR
jgi:hypothetical protein